VRQLLARRAGPVAWLAALTDYFVKRLLRVYPLFACVAVFLWTLSKENRTRYWELNVNAEYDLYKVLTFAEDSRFYVFWSLPPEISYYFYIPALTLGVCLLDRFAWLLLAPLYYWVLDEGFHVTRGAFQPLRPHLPTFIAGSLAAFIYGQLDRALRRPTATPAMVLQAAHPVVRFLVGCVRYGAIALSMSLVFHGLFFHWLAANPFPPQGGSPFLSVPVSVALVLEILFPSVLSPLLEWRLLCHAGKVSFSMYLLHPFVIKSEFIESRQATWHDQFFAWVGLVFALSTAVYWTIEYPMQRVAERVSAKIRELERRHTPRYDH
jgi:peptidoglycan/LPS O-acetylase OafA/YrhL